MNCISCRNIVHYLCGSRININVDIWYGHVLFSSSLFQSRLLWIMWLLASFYFFIYGFITFSTHLKIRWCIWFVCCFFCWYVYFNYTCVCFYFVTYFLNFEAIDYIDFREKVSKSKKIMFFSVLKWGLSPHIK